VRMELENYTLSLPPRKLSGLVADNRIPGALPQVPVELSAFGAKHVQGTLC